MTAAQGSSHDRKRKTFQVEYQVVPSFANKDIWVATRPCKLLSVREVHSVVSGSGGTLRPRKITDTTAPGAAASATCIELTAAISLETTINTVQTPTLVTTGNVQIFKAGNRLAILSAGTITGVVGVLVFEFEAL
jgi:hypothetical protein